MGSDSVFAAPQLQTDLAPSIPFFDALDYVVVFLFGVA